jgi:hypothetical protein
MEYDGIPVSTVRTLLSRTEPEKRRRSAELKMMVRAGQAITAGATIGASQTP